MVESFRKYWHGDQGELHLLVDLRDDDAPRRERIAAVGAVVAQFAIIGILFYIPMGGGTPVRFFPEVWVEMGRVTPVFVPRDVIDDFRLTQKAPQTKAPATEVNLEKLLPRTGRERSPAPGPPASAGPVPAPKSPAPPEPEPPKRPALDPPRVETAQRGSVPQPAGPAPDLAPPPPEQPKLAFERVGPPPGAPTGATTGSPRLLPPSRNPEVAARQTLRPGQTPRPSATDADAPGGGGIGEMANQTPAPGSPGSALELLSDPMGVDFKPYLIQVLARVRRNWMSVMPESARFGQRGRTVVQFAIDRNGGLPKVAIVTSSGLPGLDRAAIAGLTSSIPFPPLPPEFQGREIRLQFVFSYNMPAR